MVDGRNTAMLKNRRALEALRNGVPNGDAVAVLGCNQPAVEREFNTLFVKSIPRPTGQKYRTPAWACS